MLWDFPVQLVSRNSLEGLEFPGRAKILVSKMGMWLKRNAWEQCEWVLFRDLFLTLCQVPSGVFLKGAKGSGRCSPLPMVEGWNWFTE